MTTKTKQHPRNRRGRSSPAKRRATSRGWVVWAALAGIALLAVGSVLLLRGDGGNGTSPIVGGDLHSLVTPDGTTIYAGGHTAVSVSHDGGATWARIPSLDD